MEVNYLDEMIVVHIWSSIPVLGMGGGVLHYICNNSVLCHVNYMLVIN